MKAKCCNSTDPLWIDPHDRCLCVARSAAQTNCEVPKNGLWPVGLCVSVTSYPKQ